MADPPSKTYRPIPPPPLPEFYLKKPASKMSSTCTSLSDDGGVRLPSQPRQQRHLPPARYLPPAPVDGAGDGPTYRTYTYTTAVNLPPAPPMEPVDAMPPLAVYHICRICVRPRSARYHREHPIPIDGLPPPPGICRRCRIASVDGSKTIAEVVELHESGEVKLGIKCLVPDDDYVSADVMRAKTTERFIQQSEYIELESASERDGDVIYRRVRASAPQERAAEVVYRPTHMMVPPPPPPGSTRVTSKSQATVALASNAATMGQSSTSRLDSPEMSRPIPVRLTSPTYPKRAESVREVTKAARSSRSSRSRHRHRTSIVIEAPKPERTEAEIRRLARDEVVRYRQAERMMEAYGDVFAHGRLVPVEQAQIEPAPTARIPVERRIALEKDVVHRPWVKSPERPRPLELASASTRKAVVADDLPYVARRDPDRERSPDRRKLMKAVHALESRTESQVESRERSLSKAKYTRARRHSRRGPVTIENEETPTSTSIYKHLFTDPPASQPASSDKTRWADTGGYRPAEVPETSRKQNVVEVDVEAQCDKESAASTSSSKWTDREYWLDGQPAKTALGRSSLAVESPKDDRSSTPRAPRLFLRRQSIATETVPTEPAAGSCSYRTRFGAGPSAEAKIPPYPAEESITSAQMPSPKLRVSKAKTSHPQNSDSEYIYVERTVQAARSSSRSGREKPYYESQEIFGQRRKFADDKPKLTEEPGRDMRRRDSKHDTSDVSSRVHFAKQVEFSPTPPGSDASSTHFRALGRMKAPRPEKGADLIAEYERRGRARSRVPYEGYDYR